MYCYVFGVAEFESEVRIGPSGHNFLLTSKTCFATFIFSKRNSVPKILKKFTEVYLTTINDHEFFQNFWSDNA